LATVRRDREQNQTIQVAAATPASTITNAAPAQATAPQDQSVTQLTDQENADNEVRCIEAMRVAVNNNVSLRLDGDQAAKDEPTQRALDHLPIVTAEGISGDILDNYHFLTPRQEEECTTRWEAEGIRPMGRPRGTAEQRDI
jgi:hypothetical protein